MPKCDFNKVAASNFIEITLRHGCSPVNLLHIFRTPFPENISGGLLLVILNKGLSAKNSKIPLEKNYPLMTYQNKDYVSFPPTKDDVYPQKYHYDIIN